jgi:anthranilate/para-aminobenzoate synthase component II
MITIIDFDDSFTFNLYSELCHMSETRVIHFKDLDRVLSDTDFSKKQCFVLGPGPGHPADYQEITKSLNVLINKENVFLFGVCLGHQLLWQAFGVPTSPALSRVHGQSEKIRFSSFFDRINNILLKVQRYNSLSVHLSDILLQRYCSQGWRLVDVCGELYASSYKNILTYQFHPESIGTSHKALLYSPLKDFLLS